MKKNQKRPKGVERAPYRAGNPGHRAKESLDAKLEMIVDQILETAPIDARTDCSCHHKTASAHEGRPRTKGSIMSEEEINSLMERMIFSENVFNGYTH